MDFLLRSPGPVRVTNVSEHPASAGIPPHHPIINTLLGVRVDLHDTTIGLLYLANKQGAPEFTAQDEEAVANLAIAAGLAIENARLAESERRRQRWLEATAEMTHLLLGKVNRDEALRVVTRRVLEVSGADSSGIFLVDPADPEGMVTFDAVEGYGSEELTGVHVPRGGFLTEVLDTGRPVISPDFTRDERFDQSSEWAELLSVLGLGIFVPLVAQGEMLGALAVSWRRGSPHERTATQEAGLVEAFAGQAALALQQVQADEVDERRRHWIEAAAEITRLLLGEVDRNQAMRLVTRRMLEVSCADYGGIIVRDLADPGSHVLVHLEGRDERFPSDVRIPRQGLAARVLETGQAFQSDDFVHEEGYQPIPAWEDALAATGLGMLTPLTASGEVLGVLFTAWNRESPCARVARRETELVRSFADQAALVLQQIQAQEDRDRRQRWLEATTEMTRVLLGDVDRDEALRVVTRRLREVSGADYGGVIMIDPADPYRSLFVIIDGLGLEIAQGTRVSQRGLTARVIRSAQAFITDDLAHEPDYSPHPGLEKALSGVGLCMLTPLVASGEVLGVLVAGWLKGSPHAGAAKREHALVQSFADQAALILQRVEAQRDRGRLLVLEDRDRIAGALHHVIIQRLFDIGTRLETAAGLADNPQVQQRVTEAIGALDETTQQVRSTIFELAPDDVRTIESRLLDEIDSARALLGFTPRLVVRGPLERSVPPRIRRELVPVVREALANAATHASPHTVEVTLLASTSRLVLTVSDDGTEPGDLPAGDQIADMKERAERLGGRCAIRPREAGGTVLEWQVPVG